MDVGWALPVAWVTLGAVVVGTALGAGRSRRAYVASIRTVRPAAMACPPPAKSRPSS